MTYEIEFGPTLPDGEGGKSVTVYVDGVDVGELYRRPQEGQREWAADGSIAEALGPDVDPYGFDDRELRTVKANIKRAAREGGAA